MRTLSSSLSIAASSRPGTLGAPRYTSEPPLSAGQARRRRWPLGLLGRGCASALLVAATVGTSLADTPAPPVDPMGAPSRYAVARSDDLFITKIAADGGDGVPYAYGSTAQLKPDLSGVGQQSNFSVYSPGGDLPLKLHLETRGRYLDPLHDQVLDLGEFHAASDNSLHYRLASALSPDFPRWEPAVPTGSEDTPAALTSGDLDRAVSADGNFHDEAAVAMVGADGRLQVYVVDYNIPGYGVVQTAADAPLPVLGDGQGNTGSLAIGVGDFDGDGFNEIAVAWQSKDWCYDNFPAACAYPVHLSFLRYATDGTQHLLHVLQADAPLPPGFNADPNNHGQAASPNDLRISVADFDGQGRDEIALAFTQMGIGLFTSGQIRSANVKLNVLGFDQQLAWQRFGQNTLNGPGCQTGVGYCLPTARPRLTNGLFHYDEAKGFTLGRRQVAVSWMSTYDPDNRAVLQLFDVTSANPDCAVNCTLQFAGLATTPFMISEAAQNRSAAPEISLTAGGFRGLSLGGTPAPPLWGIAAGVLDAGSARVAYIRLDGTTLTEFYSGNVRRDGGARYTVTAYDDRGQSLVLGAPIRLTYSNLVRTDMIVQDPPKHADWLCDQQAKTCAWYNVDRTEAYNVLLSNSSGQTYSSKTTTKSDWDIGGSATLSNKTTVEEGLFGVGKIGGSLEVSGTIAKSHSEDSASYNGDSSSYELTINQATNDDDLVGGRQQTIYDYRYPILGRTLNDASGKPIANPDNPSQPLYPFYEIVLTGPTVPIPVGGGRNFSWYQPLHENGNALSYPPISGAGLVDVSADVGPPVALTGGGGATVPQPLINTSYFVDRTSSSPDLTIKSATSSGSDTTTSDTLAGSTDVNASLNASINVGVAKGSNETTVDLKFDDSKTTGNQQTADHEVSSAKSFTLIQDEAAVSSQAYQAATAYYYTKDGTTKVKHAVNLLASYSGKQFWIDHYTGHADPALNLPNHIEMQYDVYNKSYDIPGFWPTATRQLIRGFSMLHPNDPSSPLTSGAPLGGDPSDGDKVVLAVRVYNYSLDTPASNVPVRFEAVPVDAANRSVLGPPKLIGTTTVGSIAPLGMQIASLAWDTTGFGPSLGGQQYRMFVTVDPSGTVPNPIHAWQNRFPNYPSTVDGTPKGDPLIDPRTGQAETLEPGQNKQGFGLVTVQAHQAPQLLQVGRQAKAARGLSLTGPDLRLGGGALLAGAPAGGVSGQQARVDQEVPLTVRVESDVTTPEHHSLLLYDGDPAHGGRVIAGVTVPGVPAGAGTDVSVDWRPTTPGVHHLVAQLIEDLDDSQPGNNVASLDVTVGDRQIATPRLQSLADAIGLVSMPAGMRTALTNLVRRAQQAQADGRSVEVHALLQALVGVVKGASGRLLSDHDAGRILALAEPLLAQASGGTSH